MSTGSMARRCRRSLDALKPEERWAITDFIASLSGGDGPGYTNLVIAKYVQEPIDLKKGAASFQSARVARFPIIGQIMEPGRAFHPPTTSRDGSGHLRCRFGRPPPAMARHERGEDGQERAVASRAGGRRGRSVGGRRQAATRPAAPALAMRKLPRSAAQRQPPAADPFAEEPAAQAGQPSEFSDAVAIQIPTETPTGARKPYFIFGDAQNSVDLWFFDLALPDPVQFTGRGSADIKPSDAKDLTGVASYDQGEWSVIFKRPLRPASGAAFSQGQFLPIAFSVWDGFSRERGNRRGLTAWSPSTSRHRSSRRLSARC